MNVTVLTFNVFQLRLKGSRRRAALALQTIRQADPDIIVLNEVFNRPARALVGRLRSAGYHATPHLGGFGRGWTGVSGRPRGLRRIFGGGVYILSRIPIEAQRQHIYRTVAPRTTEVLSNKGAVLVALRCAGERLWLVGTHLHADEHGSRHAERMGQLAELRAFVAATVPTGETLILAGDLNVEYYSADGQPGTDIQEASRAVGAPLAGDAIHDFTFDGTTNPLTRKDYPNYRNVLDYICLLRPDRALTVRSTTLYYDAGQEASDHYPVLAKVGPSARPQAPIGSCG